MSTYDLVVIGIIAFFFLFILVILPRCTDRKREKRLSSISLVVRRRFESREKLRNKNIKTVNDAEAKAAQIIDDDRRSREAKVAIAIAQVEGRSYTRVWVRGSSFYSVIRWAERNDLRAIKVRSGKHGDVQISISDFDRNRTY